MALTLSSVRTANSSAASALYSLSSPSASTKPAPVAVLLGGTSGIGAGIARALNRHTNGRIQLFLSGRNEDAANEVIASLPFPPPSASEPEQAGKAEFVRCDATSMTNVRELARVLKEEKGLSRVNYLVLTPGFVSLAGSEKTEEGLERKLALSYYARLTLTLSLLPLLRRAHDLGHEARILTVLAPGRGGGMDLDDLDLEKAAKDCDGVRGRARWLRAAQNTTVTSNDWMVKTLADENPGLSFIHAYPGVVKTNITSSFSAPLRFVANGLFTAFGTSADNCGEYMAHLLFSPEFFQGFWHRGSRAEEVKGIELGTEEERKKVFEHGKKVAGVE